MCDVGSLGEQEDCGSNLVGLGELPRCCCSVSEQCQVCCTNPPLVFHRPEPNEVPLYRTNLWEHLKQIKKQSFADVPKQVAEKKRKAEDDAALTRAMASIEIGSNVVNELKKLKISTQQGSVMDSAQVVGRHVTYNSALAPLTHRGNGEAFSQLNRRASQASSSDVSRLFQRGQCSFGDAKL